MQRLRGVRSWKSFGGSEWGTWRKTGKIRTAEVAAEVPMVPVICQLLF